MALNSQQVENWVNAFADSVVQQTEAIKQGDHRAGNKCAKQYIKMFERLRGVGDAGRDTMLPLLSHPRSDVRATAAAFLLRYKTKEAMAVLRTEAAGKGLVAFEAAQALKRWEEGAWDLDPA